MAKPLWLRAFLAQCGEEKRDPQFLIFLPAWVRVPKCKNALLLIAVGGSREGLAKDVLNRIVQKAIGWKENKTARDKEKEMEGEIP
jgi:hypothetical protein